MACSGLRGPARPGVTCRIFFGPWNSVYRQFRRWTVSGLWDVMLEALNESGIGHDSLQMIDSTIVRAHQHAAGSKRGLRKKLLDARAVAFRPRSI
jgi:transposase